MSHNRNGFTLVEIAVAVTLTGVVAVLAHQLFGAAADHSHRLLEARTNLDRTSNAHRFLATAFLSVEVGVDSAGPFLGDAQRVQFPAWITTSDGWLERRTLTLSSEGDLWIATAAHEQRIELARGVTGLRYDYLLEPGGESEWVPGWESQVSAPLAVRIQVTSAGRVDTLLFLIKARG